jgi:23S rRNA (uracil1939-C5)-methyltransferase
MLPDTNNAPGDDASEQVEAPQPPETSETAPPAGPDSAQENAQEAPHEQVQENAQGEGQGVEQPELEPVPAVEPGPELVIEKWVYGGSGLARADGKVLMVPYTLPGERVRVRIAADHGGFAEARVTEMLERSAERVEPQCPVFGLCGGCHYQQAGPEFQAAQKAEIVREVFQRVGKIKAPEQIDVLTGEPWGYRNRTQFHSDGLDLGFLEAGSHDLVPVDHCPISAPKINESLQALRYMIRDRGWPRFVRTLELFTNGEQTMVNVLETEGSRGVAKGFFDWLGKQIPGAELGGLEYECAGAKFRVSHGAFFQVNRFMVDSLAAAAVEGAEGNIALDLYSGVGLFTLRLAKQFTKVAGVESNHQAARDLTFNAERAGVTIPVHPMQAEQYLEGRKSTPDFVLADPPRSGLGKRVVQHLVALKPREIRVVSCDPATLARDAAGLIAGGYSFDKLTVADLFPQTYHVESIAVFRAV